MENYNKFIHVLKYFIQLHYTYTFTSDIPFHRTVFFEAPRHIRHKRSVKPIFTSKNQSNIRARLDALDAFRFSKRLFAENDNNPDVFLTKMYRDDATNKKHVVQVFLFASHRKNNCVLSTLTKHGLDFASIFKKNILRKSGASMCGWFSF